MWFLLLPPIQNFFNAEKPRPGGDIFYRGLFPLCKKNCGAVVLPPDAHRFYRGHYGCCDDGWECWAPL